MNANSISIWVVHFLIRSILPSFTEFWINLTRFQQIKQYFFKTTSFTQFYLVLPDFT